jgi:hypothetical protein
MEWEAKKGVAIDANSFAQIMANLISKRTGSVVHEEESPIELSIELRSPDEVILDESDTHR